MTFPQSNTVQNLFKYSSFPQMPYPAVSHACSCTERQKSGYNWVPILSKSAVGTSPSNASPSMSRPYNPTGLSLPYMLSTRAVVWKPRTGGGALSPDGVPGSVGCRDEGRFSGVGYDSPSAISSDRKTLPLDLTKRVPAPKVGMTPMVARLSTATQTQPEDDIPMAAAETVDLSCSKEPKSWRIAMLNSVEISASLVKAFAGGGFFGVV